MIYLKQLAGTIALGAAIVVVSGCAAKPTVSENQCRAGDWQTIGYRDGAMGKDSTRLLEHQEACGAFGIFPERDTYLAGWQEGLATFCTGDNGFQQGVQGRYLNGSCRGELREPFASAHADGRALYQARREVSRLEHSLANQEQRLVQIKEEMVGATTAQLVPDLTAQERLSLLNKLDSLVDEKAEIKAQIPQTERALMRAEDRLAELDQSLAVR